MNDISVINVIVNDMNVINVIKCRKASLSYCRYYYQQKAKMLNTQVLGSDHRPVSALLHLSWPPTPSTSSSETQHAQSHAHTDTDTDTDTDADTDAGAHARAVARGKDAEAEEEEGLEEEAATAEEKEGTYEACAVMFDLSDEVRAPSTLSSCTLNSQFVHPQLSEPKPKSKPHTVSLNPNC